MGKKSYLPIYVYIYFVVCFAETFACVCFAETFACVCLCHCVCNSFWSFFFPLMAVLNSLSDLSSI